MDHATADSEADTRQDNNNTHNNFFASPRQSNNEGRNHDKDNRELMKAVKEGQLHRVKYLIDRGADIDYHDADGDTPLTRAAEDERVEIVKTLILAGADVNWKNGFEDSAIHHAVGAETDEAFAILQILLWAGCELEGKNLYGDPPLHRARTARIAKALIQGGADIESRTSSLEFVNMNGFTPLHWHASRAGGIEIVEILIQAGADVNARCDKGKTPLEWCLKRGENRASTIALLRAHGARE
jgi:ankyrin repeat protein